MAPTAKPEKLAISMMLMEDDEIDARLITLFSHSFQRYRPQITHVCDIKSASAAMDEHFYDVLLLDFWLEGQNSLKFLTELERRDIRVPTIILSNISPHQVESLRLTEGGAIFVAKGACSAQVLETAVEESFALARAADAKRPRPELA